MTVSLSHCSIKKCRRAMKKFLAQYTTNAELVFFFEIDADVFAAKAMEGMQRLFGPFDT